MKASTPPFDLRIQYPPVAGSAAIPAAITPAGRWPMSEPYPGVP
jgi:hypothetical protein